MLTNLHMHPTAKPFTLEQLCDELAAAKAAEAKAKQHREAIEHAIVTHADVAPGLRDEGTHHVGRVKVVTGLTRKWDQPKLVALASEIDETFWPFKVEWKEDRRAMRVFEERFPELANKIGKALTLTPRKPTVSVSEAK